MPVHARSAADPIRTSVNAGGSGGASFNSGSVAPTSDHSCWSVSSARAPCRCSAVRWTTSTWAQRHQTGLSPERLCVRCSSQAYDSSTVASRLGSHCVSKQQIGPHGGCQFGIVLRPELGASAMSASSIMAVSNALLLRGTRVLGRDVLRKQVAGTCDVSSGAPSLARIPLPSVRPDG